MSRRRECFHGDVTEKSQPCGAERLPRVTLEFTPEQTTLGQYLAFTLPLGGSHDTHVEPIH